MLSSFGAAWISFGSDHAHIHDITIFIRSVNIPNIYLLVIKPMSDYVEKLVPRVAGLTIASDASPHH